VLVTGIPRTLHEGKKSDTLEVAIGAMHKIERVEILDCGYFFQRGDEIGKRLYAPIGLNLHDFVFRSKSRHAKVIPRVALDVHAGGTHTDSCPGCGCTTFSSMLGHQFVQLGMTSMPLPRSFVTEHATDTQLPLHITFDALPHDVLVVMAPHLVHSAGLRADEDPAQQVACARASALFLTSIP